MSCRPLHRLYSNGWCALCCILCVIIFNLLERPNTVEERKQLDVPQLNQAVSKLDDRQLHQAGLHAGFPQVQNVKKNESNDIRNVDKSQLQQSTKQVDIKPVLWLMETPQNELFEYLIQVFTNLGYNVLHQEAEPKSWNILWSRIYPFPLKTKLLHHHRINHIPHSHNIFLKSRLVTSGLSHIPKAFNIPDQNKAFLEYSKLHPDIKWLQKKWSHKGISIKKVSDLNLTDSETFIQQYVDDALLVDGRRFSFAIYTVVTSINPLRIYIYNDWHVRFCKEKYHPFDPNIKEKFIADGNYIDPWHIEPIKKYLAKDISRKEALLLYFQEQGLDVSNAVEQMYGIINEAFLKNEAGVIEALKQYTYKKNMFELCRFDFLWGADLNVYLIEANMSPMLKNGKHLEMAPFFRRLIYDAASLTGLTLPSYHRHHAINNTDMEAWGPDVHVYAEVCVSQQCKESCEALDCHFCKDCLASDEEQHLKTVYNEHLNRRGFRRIFPRTFQSPRDAAAWKYKEDKEFQMLNSANKLMTFWYRGKCMKDATWCL